MHGADWNKVRETYRPVVQDITYREDFYILFSLVLGELILVAAHTVGTDDGNRSAALLDQFGPADDFGDFRFALGGIGQVHRAIRGAQRQAGSL